MKRLIDKGLMFGNLFHVDSLTLVERYNRALDHLIGKTTSLDDFHIDISGYSPEIGDELEDHYYLNHGGVNRQFILLSLEQRSCPLLNAKFSTNRHILRRFIDANERQLFALTSTDAVAGELENSVFAFDRPERLFDLRRVVIEADTTTGTISQAERLEGLIERFMGEVDAWFDDTLIEEMIETAGLAGDITRNPVHFKHEEFEQKNFWTSHFDGLYLFQDVPVSGLIACGAKPHIKSPVKQVMELSDHRKVSRFLRDNGLVEHIVKVTGDEEVAILKQKQDFIVAAVLAEKGMDLTGLSRSDMRRLAARHACELPAEYEGLASVIRWAESGGAKPRIRSGHPAYFYLLRATDGPVRYLANMLLAELTPLDFRQLFICHKEAFYCQYRGWPEQRKAYAADLLGREYAMDKVGERARLFGIEPDMSGDMPRPCREHH